MSTETSVTPLSLIELDLHQVGFETRYVSPTENPATPYEQLYVLLEELSETRLLMAQLLFSEDIVRATAQRAEQTPPALRMAHLQLTVPLQLKKSARREMAQLIAVVNRYFVPGCLGLSEAEGVYFRQTLSAPAADQVDTYLLVVALETALANIKRFLPDLAALAYGKATLDTILKKLKQKAAS